MNPNEEIELRERTPEEEKYLVVYYMKPENTELALAIGLVQVQIREKIPSCFLKDLEESARAKSDQRGLNWNGKQAFQIGSKKCQRFSKLQFLDFFSRSYLPPRK